MSDYGLRDLERAAQSGDGEAAARLLLERARRGSLTRDRIELAAYCGDERALKALSMIGLHIAPDLAAPEIILQLGFSLSRAFTSWVRGLRAWEPLDGGKLMVRASVAASRAAEADWSVVAENEGVLSAARNGLALAEQWVGGNEDVLPVWDDYFDHLIGSCLLGKVPFPGSNCFWIIADCARLSEERVVREAVCRELIDWSLD